MKKKPSVRSSVKDEVEVPSSTQSAADRRSAEAQLRTLVAKFAPSQLRLIAAVRRLLRKRLPTAHEVVYEYRAWFVISFSPSEQGYEGVLAIRGDADGVKFYFNRGKELPDPEKLLKGSASLVRFFDIEKVATLSRPAVASLIEAAIALNQVPFSLVGNGSVVIRTSAKQPRLPRPD